MEEHAVQKKRVMCPNCNLVLDISNSKNVEEKRFLCPKCQRPLYVRFKKNDDSVEAHTYYVKPQPETSQQNNYETQLGCGSASAKRLRTNAFGAFETQLNASQTNQAKMTATLDYSGRSYILKEGRNIIGRRAVTSLASIQIMTDDRSMSRQHCCINVTTLPNGMLKVVLSNYQNKNLTIVNGQEITDNDAIRLHDGYRITMGLTTITFHML